MTANRLGLVFIGLTLVGLGFAAMSTNPLFQIPSWVPYAFFITAVICFLWFVILLLRGRKLSKANIFNTAQPLAEASLLSSDITPKFHPSYMDVSICMDNSGVFRVARTVNGVTKAEDLNSGVALVAGSMYAFTVRGKAGDSINFRYSVTGGNILELSVDEYGE